jgi:hypothetical protein
MKDDGRCGDSKFIPGGPIKETTISILSTWEYYMYPMEPQLSKKSQ